eukprot:6208009-Pleurochrysis_carterae.AAC.2
MGREKHARAVRTRSKGSMATSSKTLLLAAVVATASTTCGIPSTTDCVAGKAEAKLKEELAPESEKLLLTRQLLGQIAQRVHLMRDVAAAKAAWERLPAGSEPCVFDAAQEQRVLHAAAQTGSKLGIPSSKAVMFAQLQADCAKQEQAFWFGKWLRQGSVPSAAKSLDEIRAALSDLNTQLFRSWRDAQVGEWDSIECSCLWRRAIVLMDVAFANISGTCGDSIFKTMILGSLMPCSEPHSGGSSTGTVDAP